NVSHRGYTNSILEFSNCRVPKSAVLGEPHRGFEVANAWLGATRLQVAASCLGRAERALDAARQWAVDRVQFGQQIGKFQGVSFKLADMVVEQHAAAAVALAPHFPFHTGLRFSEKARAPSFRSSERMTFCTAPSASCSSKAACSATISV